MNDIPTLDLVPLPETFRDEAHLEDFMSTPTRGLVDDFAELEGDLLVLGVAGKVGPTLAMMAKRAAPTKRVIGVARFSKTEVRRRLEAAGVETITCDLLDREAVNRLPDVQNVIFMAGKKFGTTGGESLAWAMNAVVPAYIGERLCGARFVVFSTLCVYPFFAVDGPGATPNTALTPPGEYANGCVARERVFQYFSQTTNSPGRLARLNYAIDCRYGVLSDIAQRVRGGTPIDIRTGVANCIWQGDAISHILRCLLHVTVPAQGINIGAPQTMNVRATARRFGELFGKEPIFSGDEQPTAWHNNCSEARLLFGKPMVDLDSMIRWNADWLQRGLPLYHMPTHYERRDGRF